MNDTLIIATDPGKNGGQTYMYLKNLIVTDLYLYDMKSPAKNILKHISEDVLVYPVIEHAHARPKQGVTSMFNFGASYGKILGMYDMVYEMYPTRVKTTTLYEPRFWQKTLFGKPTGGDKEFHANWITNLPPYHEVYDLIYRYSNRSKKGYVLNDGLSDSLCIAHCMLMELRSTERKVDKLTK